MKTKLSILLLLCCFLNVSVFAQDKTKKELRAERDLQQQKETEALIDSKKFDFEAQKLNPQGGRLIILDYNIYFLRFSSDKIICDLPFFGRAFNVAYGGDGGIKFEGAPEDIKVEKKKKSYILRTTVRGKDDVYNLLFTIFNNGSTTLSVNSNNRASISYDGVIRAPKAVENK
ncbi:MULTISPECIES: DUF4251 domain-containing protein [Flavobacterium]|uniref:DUF4251 domain-containing protein n=1 Tax=Flavobacterium tructae TaxID=1114873 RepID=A0A1S1J2R8_9FLAO|nr:MULTISPECIES: DUF4251 domain-containing protein [Flavobacterium]OHT44927.1 hypothetical protein BHE19_09425 [Flavobacterium tructae]OXB18961.1 hypothetical protein B0A71_13545 [Flavobacterium tructae]URC12491.1 DUF4251 domain-containing protein [Flavobacterium sp. B183]